MSKVSPVAKVIPWIPVIREVIQLGQLIASRVRARRARRRRANRKQ